MVYPLWIGRSRITLISLPVELLSYILEVGKFTLPELSTIALLYRNINLSDRAFHLFHRTMHDNPQYTIYVRSLTYRSRSYNENFTNVPFLGRLIPLLPMVETLNIFVDRSTTSLLHHCLQNEQVLLPPTGRVRLCQLKHLNPAVPPVMPNLRILRMDEALTAVRVMPRRNIQHLGIRQALSDPELATLLMYSLRPNTPLKSLVVGLLEEVNLWHAVTVISSMLPELKNLSIDQSYVDSAYLIRRLKENPFVLRNIVSITINERAWVSPLLCLIDQHERTIDDYIETQLNMLHVIGDTRPHFCLLQLRPLFYLKLRDGSWIPSPGHAGAQWWLRDEYEGPGAIPSAAKKLLKAFDQLCIMDASV
ncbi:hypothetical protein OE88DRAFT_1640799 [Heliocybe sulcata]|uniref:Uncharacterized protein n=1 Tax=Heliocybe sulcata TaxID=5364 RepID=A0A5C3NHZ8_9AGAM|nr:hypothetical protein OE88DRAFT_1640799 [Heliocybe sulcata]